MSEEDSSSNSGSETFTQQAYVGLKGAFGQIALGRHPGISPTPTTPCKA